MFGAVGNNGAVILSSVPLIPSNGNLLLTSTWQRDVDRKTDKEKKKLQIAATL